MKKKLVNATVVLCVAALLQTNCPANAAFFQESALKPSPKATYSANSGFFNTATSANDVFTFYGSSTKTIQILSVKVTQERDVTNSALAKFFLVKRSTTPTGGTSSTVSAIPLDSSNAASTATNIKSYTVNPTVGTSVGIVSSGSINYSPPSGSFANYSNPVIQLYSAERFGQAITLRGTGEGVAVSLNNTTNPINASIMVEIVWVEF